MNYVAVRRSGTVWREVLRGADASTPRRRGQHLETQQRLGIVPTWTFWNRRDVWRLARWYAHPMTFVALQAGFWVPTWLDLAPAARVLASPAIGVGVLALALGALERYIRSRLPGRRARPSSTALTAARAR